MNDTSADPGPALTFFGLLCRDSDSVLACACGFFGFYTIVEERQCKVYVLFGKVIGQLDEPGLHFLLPKLGLRALIVNFFGDVLHRLTCAWTSNICAASR